MVTKIIDDRRLENINYTHNDIDERRTRQK